MKLGARIGLGLLAAVVLLAVVVQPAAAQITSASVAGTVKDSQGGVIPGATVVMTSVTRGTTIEAMTGDEGYFVFPIVPADTYTLRITMVGFKTVEVPALQVNAGDKRTLGTLTVEVGALEESITVAARATELQAKSAERSFAIEGEAVQSIAVNGRNFFALAFNSAGIVNTAAQPGALGAQSNTMVANGMRANQNNVQIDGITSMDTGSNQGPSVSLAIDAVQEIKVLTSNYQAEYGRSAGAQITAVTKSGGRDFRGSVFALRRNDDMNANTWFNNRAIPARPVPPLEQSDIGYSIGGPVILPGGFNRDRSKLFFFFYQEYQQRVLAQAPPQRVRVPTELERRGDFSQTRDSAGNLFPYIRDYTTGLPCSATNTSGCFQDGGVLGRIPANRLYDVGLNILKMYPAANSAGAITQGFNHVTQEGQDAPNRNDLIRLDWLPNSSWRVYGKLLQSFGTRVAPYGGGTTGFATNIPEFGSRDDQRDNRGISVTAAVTLNNTTFLEMTYGRARNAFTNIPRSDDFTKANLGLSALPLLYPGAVQLDLPPRFNYGGRVGTFSPTNSTEYAPFLNENPTQDVAGSLTKTFGPHTVKTGAYFTHGFKPQSHRAPANGNISFTNDASNPYDTGYPFANAALGIYQTFSQANEWFQGEWLYNNVEWYVQDNWRASDRLTLDYGLRFYWMQPTHDENNMASNFLPDEYDASKAPRLYYPAIVNGVRVALDRATGQTQPAAAIGRIVPGSGTLQNGLFQQGNGISDRLYLNDGIKYAPRFGVSYDLTGKQKYIFRGGAGVFYNRPMGDTVYGMIEQPPSVVSPTLFYGRLQDIDPNNALVAPPTLFAFEYDGTFPRVYAFNAGFRSTTR